MHVQKKRVLIDNFVCLSFCLFSVSFSMFDSVVGFQRVLNIYIYIFISRYFLLIMDTWTHSSMYPFVRPSIPLMPLSGQYVFACFFLYLRTSLSLLFFMSRRISLSLNVPDIAESFCSPDPQTAAATHPGAIPGPRQQGSGDRRAGLRPSSRRLFQLPSTRPAIGRFPGAGGASTGGSEAE